MVRPPLGDLVLHFRIFEENMRVIQTDSLSYTDGYAEPNESYEKPFLGIMADNSKVIPEFQGTREMADRLLYIRLSQDWYPDLVEGDIVIDPRDDKWKVIERFDYETHANTMVFGVVRADP